jgi:hypothetical protein
MTKGGLVKTCLFLGFTKTVIFHLFPPPPSQKTHNRGAFYDIYWTNVEINVEGLQNVVLNWQYSHNKVVA